MPADRDGSRMISADEFDEIFDSGSDEIDEYIDWSHVRTDRDTVRLELDLQGDFVEWMRWVVKVRGTIFEHATQNFVAEKFIASFSSRALTEEQLGAERRQGSKQDAA